VYIFASVYHTLMISPKFLMLEMTAWPSDCFAQLQSLVMGQWGPKHVGVLLKNYTIQVCTTHTVKNVQYSLTYSKQTIFGQANLSWEHNHIHYMIFIIYFRAMPDWLVPLSHNPVLYVIGNRNDSLSQAIWHEMEHVQFKIPICCIQIYMLQESVLYKRIMYV
jgi:hypothetical protein